MAAENIQIENNPSVPISDNTTSPVAVNLTPKTVDNTSHAVMDNTKPLASELDVETTAEDFTDMGFVMPRVNASALVDVARPSLPDFDISIENIKQRAESSKAEVPNIAQKMRDSLNTTSFDINELRSQLSARASKYVAVNTSSRIYDVNPMEAYESRSDGTLVPRFKDFKAGVDNEDRLAKQQSTGERWINGLGKFGGKTLLYTVGNIVNPIYGAIKAVKDGNFEAVYSNDLVDWMNDRDMDLRHMLPNYVAKEDRDKNVIQKMATANFWADEVLGAASYTLAAIGSEAVWAAATGGISIVGAAGRMGFRAVSKAAVRGAFRGGLVTGSRAFLATTKSGMNAYLRSMKAYSGVAGMAHNARFLWTSAGWEASVEADGFRKQATERYIDNFKAIHNRLPSESEMQGFSKEIVNSSNSVFAANLGIVGMSNIAMFGSYFGVGTGFGKGMTKVTNKLFGVGMVKSVDDAGKVLWTSINPSKLQKIAGKTYYAVRKPFTEGIWEEGMQGVARNTGDKYIDSRFDSNALEKNMSFLQSLKSGFGKEFTTKEGWNEMGIGMIIGGFFGGDLRPKSFKIGEFGRYGRERAANDRIVEAYNKNGKKIEELALSSITDPRIAMGLSALNSTVDPAISRMGLTTAGTLSNVNDLASQTANGDSALSSSGSGDFTSGIRDWNMALFSRFEMDSSRNNLSDSVENFNYVIDNIDNSELQKKYGVTEGVAKEMKAAFKEDYASKVEAYEKASSFADMMVGDSGHNGARQVISLHTFLAQQSYSNINGLADSLEQTLNQSGLKDAVNIRLGMDKSQLSMVNELKDIDKEMLDLQTQIGALNRRPGTSEDNTGIQNKANELNIRLMDLQKRRMDLESSFSSFSLFNDMTLDPVRDLTKGNIYTVNDLIGATTQLDKLDQLMETLKESNPALYRTLGALSSNLHGEIVQLHSHGEAVRKMSDPRFMRQYEKGLFSKIRSINAEYEPYSKEIDDKIGSSADLEGALRDFQLIRNDQDLEDSYSNGIISEAEMYSFKTLNRMLDIYKYRGSLSRGKVSENKETITNDVLDAYRNGTLVGQDYEDAILGIIVKVSNNETLTPNEQIIYDLESAYIDTRVSDLKYTRGDSAYDQLSKLINKAKKLIAPRNFEEYVNTVIDNFLNDEGNITNDKEAVTRADVDRYVELNSLSDISDLEADELSDLYLKIKSKADELGYDDITNHLDVLSALNQKEETNISNIQTIENSSDLSFDTDFNDVGRNSRNNFDNTQNVEVSQARLSDHKWNISNISISSFLAKIGVAKTNKEGDVITLLFDNGELAKIKTDRANGQFSISESDADIISRNTNLVIKNISNVSSNWVTLHVRQVDGGLKPLYTDSGYGFNGLEKVDQVALSKLHGGENASVVSVSVDMTDSYNKILIDEYRAAVNSNDKERINRAERALIDNVVIKCIDEDGNLVSVMKSTEGDTNPSDVSFRSILNLRLRAFEQIKENPIRSSFSVSFPDGSPIEYNVRTVLPGRPNLNVREDENGNIVVQNVGFVGNEPINNIGYIDEAGRLILRNKDSNVSSFFISKLTKKNRSSLPNTRIPIVVFEHSNGLKYAYPVSLIAKENTEVTNLIGSINDMIDSSAEISNDIITSLNVALIRFGLNPSVYTIPFNGSQEENVAKLRDIAERLGEISNVVDINSWIKSDTPIMDILKRDATININLNDKPFHSMKLRLDLSPTFDSITSNRNIGTDIYGGNRSNFISFSDVESTMPVSEELPVIEDSNRNDQLWDIAENSEDILELVSAYNEALAMTAKKGLKEWEKSLLDTPIAKNQVEDALGVEYVKESIANRWFSARERNGRKISPEPVDIVAQNLSMQYGIDISVQDVVDFIDTHPRMSASSTSDLSKAINDRFRKIASSKSKMNIGGIDSTSAKNFIAGVRANGMSIDAVKSNSDIFNTMRVLLDYENPADKSKVFDLKNIKSYNDFYNQLGKNIDLFNGFPFASSSFSDVYSFAQKQEAAGVPFESFMDSINSNAVQDPLVNKPEMSAGDKSELERIKSIEDITERMIAEIDFIMSRLASGIGESSAAKVKEYAGRILSGTESRESVIDGLPASFVNGIDEILTASNYDYGVQPELMSQEDTTIVETYQDYETYTPVGEAFNDEVTRSQYSGKVLYNSSNGFRLLEQVDENGNVVYRVINAEKLYHTKAYKTLEQALENMRKTPAADIRAAEKIDLTRTVESRDSNIDDLLPFQFEEKTFAPISEAKFNSLVSKLKQTGLATDIVTDMSEFNRVLAANNRGVDTFADSDGFIYGFVDSDGVVYLRSDRMNANTPIHEFGHLWLSAIKGSNPRLYKKGLNLIKGTAYWNKVNDSKFYSNLSDERKAEEALAMAIGDKGELVVNKKGLYRKLGDWLAKMWSFIGGRIGVVPAGGIEVGDMTLESFTDAAISDLLFGREFDSFMGGTGLINIGDRLSVAGLYPVNDVSSSLIIDEEFLKSLRFSQNDNKNC